MQGVEPTGADPQSARLRPAWKRMKDDFDATKALVAKEADWFLLLHTTEAAARGQSLDWPLKAVLESEQLREGFASAQLGGRWRVTRLRQWLENADASRLESQTFSRQTLDAWVRAIGVTPGYPFAPARPAPANGAAPTPGHWPWGNHHTDALGHLEAAGQRWWATYSPLEPHSAPPLQEVVQWLLQERKVPTALAQSIAALLTPPTQTAKKP